MKSKFGTNLIAAIGFSLFAASSQAIPVELVTNGGFETGDFTGWTQFPNLGTQAISGVNPSSGLFSANLNGSGFPTNSLIKAANVGIGQVAAGQAVEISFDMRGTAADGGVVFAEFFSELAGGGVSDAQILSDGPLFPNGDSSVWTTYSYSVLAGPDVSGGITLQLGAVCGGASSCLADIFFDNASMTIEGSSDIPLPATTWLIGCALVGLGMARRRKS